MSAIVPALAVSPELHEAALVSSAWSFEEARKILTRVQRSGQKEVLFETGYGPSGLPHIGTFGEVARTTMVRRAFETLTQGTFKTRLLAFSDDMDGLRKVPDNVPNKHMLAAYLGQPLTRVPDPFGTHDSFGAHNNARLKAFLDAFGFEYEFASSTAYYTSGKFDAALKLMLDRYDAIMAIMLPSFRAERAASYSPFLPLHPKTGVVMQVPLESHDAKAGTITWRDPSNNQRFETPVTGGQCKLQWKPDWAMRWHALKVDYEMAGKDLIDSVKLSGQITRALGSAPPEGFNYELFLDENGKKISKSLGNGIAVDEWLTYASPESLSLFMFQKPSAAKRLHFDVIPHNVDEYLKFLEAYPRQAAREQLGNPAWHIHNGAPPAAEAIGTGDHGTSISFAMLLNLAAVANSAQPQVLWGFLQRYAPDATPHNHPRLDQMVHYAVRYFRDFQHPLKTYRAPDEVEQAALRALAAMLAALPQGASAEDIQAGLYDIARAIPRYQDMKAKGATPERPGVSNDWFNMLYQVLLGENRGPRFGSFAALYGVAETHALVEKALSGALVADHAAFLAGRAKG